jgi:hypothetical protein
MSTNFNHILAELQTCPEHERAGKIAALLSCDAKKENSGTPGPEAQTVLAGIRTEIARLMKADSIGHADEIQALARAACRIDGRV